MEGNLVLQRPMHDYVMSPTDIAHLQAIMKAGSESRSDIALEIRRKLIDQLIVYYQLHVETLREVNSIKILREFL
jgi:hypothetical protein